MKKLYYRGNAFITRASDYTLLRVDNVNYKISNKKFTYSDILNTLKKFIKPKNFEDVESNINISLLKFLVKVKSIIYDDLPDELNYMQKYFIRNYPSPRAVYDRWQRTDFVLLGNAIDRQKFESKKLFFTDNKICKKNTVYILCCKTKKELQDTIDVASKKYDEKAKWIFIGPMWHEKGEIGISYFENYYTIKEYVTNLTMESSIKMSPEKSEVALNYAFILAADNMSYQNKFKNAFVIKTNLDIKNISFQYFTNSQFVFKKRKINLEKLSSEFDAVNSFLVFAKLRGEFTVSLQYDKPESGKCRLVFNTFKFGTHFYEETGLDLGHTIKKDIKKALSDFLLSFGYNVEVFIGKEDLLSRNNYVINNSEQEWLQWPELEKCGILIKKKC